MGHRTAREIEQDMIAAGATVRGVNLAAFTPPRMVRLKSVPPAVSAPDGPALRVEITLGLRVSSEPNLGGTLKAKIARKKAARTAWGLTTAVLGLDRAPHFFPPARVTLTRLGGRKLDAHDNLRAAFKYLADAIAEWLGVDDGDERLVTWSYDQKPGGPYGCRVTIEGST
jgi:hypothetical protein